MWGWLSGRPTLKARLEFMAADLVAVRSQRDQLRILLGAAREEAAKAQAAAAEFDRLLQEALANSRRLVAHATRLSIAVEAGEGASWRPIAELGPLAREAAGRAESLEVELARPAGSLWRYAVAHLSMFGISCEGASASLANMDDALALWSLWRPHKAPQGWIVAPGADGKAEIRGLIARPGAEERGTDGGPGR